MNCFTRQIKNSLANRANARWTAEGDCPTAKFRLDAIYVFDTEPECVTYLHKSTPETVDHKDLNPLRSSPL